MSGIGFAPRNAVTPLVLLVLALTAGTILGGMGDGGAAAGTWLATGAAACLVVACRWATAGHATAALLLAAPAAIAWGAGAGALAGARAWSPPGVDLAALEQHVARGDPLRVSGVLASDGWLTPDGGVAFDMLVDRVSAGRRWQSTSLGARVTVGGTLGASRLREWTRGTRVEAPVGAFRRPLPYRNFGVADAERTLARQRLRAFASVKSAGLVQTGPAPAWERWATQARHHVRRAAATHIRDPTAAAIVTAILIGDRSALAPEVERRLQLAGTYHVVAISGGNVAAFLAVLLLVPRIAGLRGRTTMAVLVAGLTGFALVVDGGASVARAVLVAALAVAARWWDVRVPAAQALAGAAAVQLIADPLTPADVGAVLSFGAAAALIWVARVSATGASRVADTPRAWRAARATCALLAATVAVEAMLLPVAVRWFGVATAAGLIANLVAVPAMLIVQATGMAVVALAQLSEWGADRGGVTAAAAVRLLLASGDVVQWAPWLVRDAPPPAGWTLATYYVALAVAAGMSLVVCERDVRARSGPRSGPLGAIAMVDASRDGPHRRTGRARWPPLLLAASAVVAAAVLWSIVAGGRERSAPAPWSWPAAGHWQHASWPREPWLLVTFLDVGQGDATVIRFPTGHAWLVDAGGSSGESFDVGVRVTTRALWALGHRRLSRVLVTHAHPDHAAGMPAVVDRLRPRELVTGVAVPGDGLGARLTTAAAAAGVAERRVAAGDTFVEGPVHVKVLHPERPDWERRRVRNEDSLVLWVRFGDIGLLLPGDVGRAEEAAWADRIAAAPLTVVRLAHHGSASSTSPRLIDALRPVLAVASMGRGNRFGHPAAAVVRRLSAADVPLLRTDEVGAIQIATNGRTLLVRTATGLSWSVTTPPPRRA